ncbi:hypothetical protein Tco_0831986 [Tanacetum coccineum]
MSDSKHSTVTYTSISSDDGSLDVGSPGVIVLGYDGLTKGCTIGSRLQYPEYLALSDEEVPAEEQPLPASFSPTTDSMDPADYPTDRDEKEEESSGDDADDEEEDKGEDGEEDEEYLAPVDSVPSPQTSTLAATFPLPSPLTPLSSPLPQIPSPPFPVPSLPTTSHTYTEKRLCIASGPTYEIGESSSASTARSTGGFRADYGFVGTLDAEIRRDLDREIGYGITDVWEDPDEILKEIPATDVVELGQRMKNFITTLRQDTNEIYVRLGDAQDDRSVMSGQLNLLRRDRRSHARTTRLMESEAKVAREAWSQSMDASDMARSETQMLALQSQQRHARDPTHPDLPEEAGSSS